MADHRLQDGAEPPPAPTRSEGPHATTSAGVQLPTPHATARNGLGIASLILGIVGILFGLVPLTFWIAGPLGVTGLVLALVGRARVKRGEATNGKTAVFGILTSLAALTLSVVGAVIVFDTVDQIDRDLQQLEQDIGRDLDEVEQQVGEDSEQFDAYLDCLDAVKLDDPDFDAEIAACDSLLE